MSQPDLEAVAKKHGWTYAPTGKWSKLDYVFTKDDVRFMFNMRGNGECILSVAGQHSSPVIFFDPNYPPSPNSFKGPRQCERDDFAERVLSRFDRKKLLDTIEKRLSELCENMRGALKLAEDDLAAFQNYHSAVDQKEAASS